MDDLEADLALAHDPGRVPGTRLRGCAGLRRSSRPDATPFIPRTSSATSRRSNPSRHDRWPSGATRPGSGLRPACFGSSPISGCFERIGCQVFRLLPLAGRELPLRASCHRRERAERAQDHRLAGMAAVPDGAGPTSSRPSSAFTSSAEFTTRSQAAWPSSNYLATLRSNSPGGSAHERLEGTADDAARADPGRRPTRDRRSAPTMTCRSPSSITRPRRSSPSAASCRS